MPNRFRLLGETEIYLRNAWLRLSGPAAFDTYVISLFAAASIWVTLVVDLGRSNGPATAWLIAGGASMFIGVCWLFVARYLFDKLQTKRGSAFFVVVFYGIAGLIRILTLDFACQLMGLTPPSDRLVVSVFSTILLLVFANTTANRRQDAQNLHASLLVERQKLIWLGASYDEKVLQAQRDLIRQLETELYPAIRNVLEKLKPANDSRFREISNDLVNTVSSVVRPICDRLSESTDTISEQLDEIAGKPIDVIKSSSKFSIRRAIRPTTTMALVLFIAASVSPALGKDSNYANFALMSAIAWLLSILIRRLWPKKFDETSAAVGFGVLTSIYAGVYLLAVLVTRSLGAVDQTLLIQASFSIGSALVIARMSFTSQARQSVEKQLQEQNLKLSQLISQLRRQIWLIRRNAAWVLHGPIQSALISSAMTLANSNFGESDRKTVTARIEEAVSALQSNNNMHQKLEVALEGIANLWSRSCTVSWRIDPQLLESLEADLDTATCLIEVATEGVSNAVRHGAARSIAIDISAPSDEIARIEIRDDGRGLGGNQEPGLGSAMLDQICLEWHRDAHAGGVILTAYVIRNSANTPQS